MALDWENPNYFLNQNNYHHFQQQNQFYPSNFQFHDSSSFSPVLETELLCFDPLPPTLFDVDESLFNPPPLHPPHEFLTPENSPFAFVDFPPPVLVPADDFLAFEDDFSTPFPKKQRLIPAHNNFNDFIFNDYSYSYSYSSAPELITQTYPNNYHYNDCYGNCNEGFGMNYGTIDDGSNNGGNKQTKAVSAQSKAARERRRKITEKTQELGKLIPGGHKMNTAEMLQAASKYVKFMQAQLGILQSIKTLQEDNDNKDAKLNNLQILASPLVQEKLYSKGKCLVPSDFLPILEEHCDFEIKPSISQHISNLHQ